MSEENMIRWAKNPQFLFECFEVTEVFISLAQPDGRVKRDEEDPPYEKFPYANRIHPVCFTVMRLPQGKNRVEKFDKANIEGVSILKEHREVSLRLKLKPGRYVIVPSTRSPGLQGLFYLSLYFDHSLDGVNVKRIDDPKNRFRVIEEEAEGIQISDQKVALIQKRLKYMMQDDDQNLNNSSFMGQPGSPQKSIKLGTLMESYVENKKSGRE